MSLKLAFRSLACGAGLTLSLLSKVAGAEEPAALPSEPQQVLRHSGLVPLEDLNRQRYKKIWFADLRFHASEFGFTIQTMNVTGHVLATSGGTGPGSDVVFRTPVEAGLPLFGLTGNYYVPLVGFSPAASLGLLPELNLLLVAPATGDSVTPAVDPVGARLGTGIAVPLFLMGRVGQHASRVSRSKVSLGAGVGVVAAAFNLGEPIAEKATFLVPAARIEVGYSVFKLSYETYLSSYDTSYSAAQGGQPKLSYRAAGVALTFLLQPEADD